MSIRLLDSDDVDVKDSPDFQHALSDLNKRESSVGRWIAMWEDADFAIKSFPSKELADEFMNGVTQASDFLLYYLEGHEDEGVVEIKSLATVLHHMKDCNPSAA